MGSIKSVLEAFKSADTLSFVGLKEPKDALLLSKIAEATNLKLMCSRCYGLSSFLNAYKEVTGSFESASLDAIYGSDIVIVFGSRISSNHIDIFNRVKEAQKRGKCIIYMHPIEDNSLENICQFIKYEPGSEEGIVALLLELFTRDKELPNSLSEYIQELDIGFLSGESSVSEEELDELLEKVSGKRATLVVGSDLYNHSEVENIAKIIGAIKRFSDIDLLIASNESELAIATICNLDKEPSGKVIELDSNGEYKGYTLDKIANAMGLNIELNELQKVITQKETTTKLELKDVEELPSFDGLVAYCVDNIQESKLIGAKQFALAAKLADGDSVEFEVYGNSLKRVFSIDTSLKGTIALNPTFDMGLSGFTVSSYRFCKIFINKVGSANE